MKKDQKGTIVIISLIATLILMSLSAYFLNALIVEMKVVESMDKAQEAYYLAESGINEAIWKLQNDNQWKENFTDPDLNPDPSGQYWSETINNDLGGGSYQVKIQNTGLGEAELHSTAKVSFLGKEAKRETRVTIFKPLESPTEEAVIFSGGSGSNVKISHSNLIINKGNIFSNHNLILRGGSTIELYDNEETDKLEGQVWASQNISLDSEVTLDQYSALCSKNICDSDCQKCPPDEKAIPTVDFDSHSENSFKSRAEELEENNSCQLICNPQNSNPYQCSDRCIFSDKEFDDLLWGIGKGGVLEVKNKITYVQGPVELKGGRTIKAEGAIVTDGSIDIGMHSIWNRKGQKDDGYSNIEIINPDYERPSGLLSKRKISFGNYSLSNNSLIEGIIYSGDQVKMIGIPHKLTIKGGVIGRQLDFMSLWEGLEIDFDNQLILNGLGYIVDGTAVEPIFSPIIEVDHWEEVY